MTWTTMLGLLVLAIGITAMPALAEEQTLSPLKQYKLGTPIQDIDCHGQKILMESPSGKPACVSEESAGKLQIRGWDAVSPAGQAQPGSPLETEGGTINDNDAASPAGASDGTEVSASTVTVIGGTATSSDAESVAVPINPNQPWTTLTYPEEFKIGEPFTINYTWTFLKYYSEANGDEWPQDNLEKYPWAQVWNPYQVGEDEDGNLWWTIKRGHEGSPDFFVKIFGNDMLKVLTKEFAAYDWKGELHLPPIEGQLDKARAHPWDLEEHHSASITLQFDKPINPPNHEYAIKVGENDVYFFYVHFDGNKGYIGTEYKRWFASNTPSAFARAQEDLSNNPYVCWHDEEWNQLSDDWKRYELLYPSTDCVGKAKPSLNPLPSLEEQIETSVIGWKDWIGRHGITENIRDYLENTLGVPPDEVERFFEKYPHLEGL